MSRDISFFKVTTTALHQYDKRTDAAQFEGNALVVDTLNGRVGVGVRPNAAANAATFQTTSLYGNSLTIESPSGANKVTVDPANAGSGIGWHFSAVGAGIEAQTFWSIAMPHA